MACVYRLSCKLESGELVSCRAFPGNARQLNEQIDEHLRFTLPAQLATRLQRVTRH